MSCFKVRPPMRGGQEPLQVLAELRSKLKAGADPASVQAELDRVEADVKMNARTPSRLVGENAPADFARAVADGSLQVTEGSKWSGGGQPSRGFASKAGGVTATGRVSKALAESTASAGGLVIAGEVYNEIAAAIRARSAVLQMGVRVVPVEKSLELPGLSAGSTGYWVAENAAIPASEPTFAVAAKLEPKELGALVPVSNRLLRDALTNPDLDGVIRDDMSEVVALTMDFGFIQGSGAAGQPRGIRNATGLTAGPNLGVNGDLLTFDYLKQAVAALRAVNAPFDQPGWIFHPSVLARLEQLKDSTGRYLADTELLQLDFRGQGGKLLGYRFQTSSQIPTNIVTGTSASTTYMLFGSDWSEAWVGENQSITLETSSDAPYTTDGGTTWVSSYQNRQTLFRATAAVDIALRRPQYFTALTGVRTS